MLAAAPWLNRLPKGDGHPVLVFPGLGASDMTTAPLRGFLRDRGYTPYPWKQGFNFGPRHGVLDACRDLVLRMMQSEDSGWRRQPTRWSKQQPFNSPTWENRNLAQRGFISLGPIAEPAMPAARPAPPSRAAAPCPRWRRFR